MKSTVIFVIFWAIKGSSFASFPSFVARQCRGGAQSKGITTTTSYPTRSTLWSSSNSDDQDEGIDQRDSKELSWPMVLEQFDLFKEMAVPYYQESAAGRWLLAGLLGLTLLNSGISVIFSFLGKDFWNALSAKDTTEFYTVLSKYLGALVLGAPIITFYRYQREQLAVHWREWMTARTFSLYTQNRVYYSLERGSEIDNPDQRITEDVNAFTAYSLQLVITLLTSAIDLVSFSSILWAIYPQLFGAIILYAGVGTILTGYFGKSLVGLNFAQLQREADLRYSLVRLRENAESIAFYAGEDLEGQAIEKRLESVIVNQRAINQAQRNLEFFTISYRYLVQILPVAVVAPKYFAGDIALGVISQSVGAFNHILSDLSIIVNQFERLSSFSAGIERLSTFYRAMRDVDQQRDSNSPLFSTVHGNITKLSENSGNQADMIKIIHPSGRMPHNEILVVKNLDLYTPDRNRILIRSLNFVLHEGENLLIVGNSGAGKSSLLRAIAGLWTVGRGTIQLPNDNAVYFLPQRPYCTLGSLKDQLLYPMIESLESVGESDGQRIRPRSHVMKQAHSEDDLVEVLRRVDMIDVARRAGGGDPKKGLQAVMDWSNILSLGEQQRLAFGRVLVNRPRLLILDEATSALDMVAEARMYNLLKSIAPGSGIKHGQQSSLTYVSVGHRPSLVNYHQKRLRLSGEGGHELSTIDFTVKADEVNNL